VSVFTKVYARKVLEDWDSGVLVGRRKINNLRYADDTLIIAAKMEEMVDIMDRLSSVSRSYGLELNRSTEQQPTSYSRNSWFSGG